jgi:phosphoketolase
MSEVLSKDEIQRLDAYWRAANYLSVGQIYLLDNPSSAILGLMLSKPFATNLLSTKSTLRRTATICRKFATGSGLICE